MNQNFSLLQNYKKENFFHEPFPHVIIQDALPETLYKKLEENVPNKLIKNINENNVRGNIYKKDIEKNENYKIWYEFLKQNSSNYFFREFYDIFKSSINITYPTLSDKIEKQYANASSNNLNNEKSFASEVTRHTCIHRSPLLQ